jgi:hypothetical protein
MCTILSLHGLHPRFPLVVAANRDERYARPSSGPDLLADPACVVAGRDLLHGGTWFGINAHGLAIAVADQGQSAAVDARRSRGLLVLDALRYPGAHGVAELLVAISTDAYNPFSLLHGDGTAAGIGHHTPAGVRQEWLGPGSHVLVSGMGGPNAALRRARAATALQATALETFNAPGLLGALGGLLATHAEPGGPDDALCRHGAETGTVSSFVALLAPQLSASRLWCAVGAPCRAPYVDYSSLLAQLARSAS